MSLEDECDERSELDREQEGEGAMSSEIEIRVSLKNFPAVKARLDQQAIDQLLEGIVSFLRKRLRPTDHVERGAPGEFRLTACNLDANCLPTLERRFSAMMLESHFSKSGNGALEFTVETKALPSEKAGSPEESLAEVPFGASWELGHRR